MRENIELACHCLQKPVAEIGLPQRSDKRNLITRLANQSSAVKEKLKGRRTCPWACKLIGKP